MMSPNVCIAMMALRIGSLSGITSWRKTTMDSPAQRLDRKGVSIVEKVTAEDFRDAEYEMSVRNLFEDIQAELLSEFHHTLIVAGSVEMTALTGVCQEVFVAAARSLDHHGVGRIFSRS
jgi:hypothetical protein